MLNRLHANMLGGVSLGSMEVRRTGIIEGWILFGLTALAPGLSNAALGFLTTALTGLAVTAAVTGLQWALMPKPPRPEDGKVPIMQAIPPRIFGAGTNRIAGAFMLWEEKDTRLLAVQALCGHPISAITGYYLHDDLVTLGGASSFEPSMQAVNPGSDGRYGDSKVLIETRLGATPGTAFAGMVNRSGGLWTSAHRGDGQAALALMCGSPASEDFQKIFPYGPPQASVIADMAKVWDPRNPAQSPTNPATWAFSKNAALILIWHQCFNPFGPREDYTKAILPVVDVWKAEADICDEDVPRASGGTEKRYECNGWATTETDPIAIQNAILASCDGWLCRRGDGALLLTVGKFREELVGTLSDADIVGRMIQYDTAEEETINRLVPKFTYPATDYTTSDTDYFEDVTAQLKDGRILASSAEFSWVHQWRQARRLGKREWLRQKERIRGTLDVRLSGFNAVYRRWIRLDTPIGMPNLNGMIIENRRAVMSLMQGGFQIEFLKHPVNIDVWNPAVDEGAAPPVPIKPVSDGIPTALVDSVTAVSSSGSVILRVALIDAGRDDLVPVVSYRLKDAGSGSPGAWVQQAFPDWTASGGLIKLDTAPVPNDRVLQVRAAYRASRGTMGPWSSPLVEVTAVVDPVAPMALASFSATGGLGRASMTFSTANDTHLDRIAIYRVPTGVTLDKSVHTKIVIAAAPGTTFSYTHGDATRTTLVTNGDFAVDANWTKGTGWSIASGKATHVAPTSSVLNQAISLTAGLAYRWGLRMLDRTAGTASVRFAGGTTTTLNGSISANGSYLSVATAQTGNNLIEVGAGGTFAGAVDDIVVYPETVACAPQGVWDLYPFPANRSGIEGPGAAPVTVTIV